MAHVLVVDDEPDWRFIVRFRAEEGGHTVVESSDGSDALQKLESGEEFDLVISDLNMPRMHGAALRAEVERRWALPFLLWSTTKTSVIDGQEIAVMDLKNGQIDIDEVLADLTQDEDVTA